MSDKLHRDIMNLPLHQKNHLQGKTPSMASSLGHRDARHAAAELVCVHFADASGDAERERFEAWVQRPPYEFSVFRYEDAGDSPWPGNYADSHVDIAWFAWKAALQGAEEKQATLKWSGCANPPGMVEPQEDAFPLHEDAPVWIGDMTDRCRSEWRGLSLRAVRMREGWWWATYASNGDTIADCSAGQRLASHPPAARAAAESAAREYMRQRGEDDV